MRGIGGTLESSAGRPGQRHQRPAEKAVRRETQRDPAAARAGADGNQAQGRERQRGRAQGRAGAQGRQGTSRFPLSILPLMKLVDCRFELKQVSKLLVELRKSSGLALSVNDLESQVDSMKRQMSELDSERNRLADELKKNRGSESEKDEALRRLTEEVDKLRNENRSLRSKLIDDKVKISNFSVYTESIFLGLTYK